MTPDVNVKLIPGLPWQKQRFTRRRLFLPGKLYHNLRQELVKRYIWSIALQCADTRAFREIDQKYLRKFEMWCWRRMENISWTDRVRFGEVLHRVKEERVILQIIKPRKDYWLGYIWRGNCLPIEGRIEVTGRRVRRRKKPLGELQEKREHSKLKEEALDRTLWRTRCLRGYGPVVRQTSG
jgi:hypothetical protein